MDEAKTTETSEAVDLIPELVAYNANVRLAHWQADSVGNAHRTLGDLYGALDGLTDDLAELVLGKAGTRALPGATLELVSGYDTGRLIGDGLGTVAELREAMEPGVDDDALNVLADMSAALNKAKYLLRV